MLLTIGFVVAAFFLGVVLSGLAASVVVGGLHAEAASMVDSYMAAARPQPAHPLNANNVTRLLRHDND